MILVTGGAGYIGSHACVALLDAGEHIVVFDNFSNSKPAALERVLQISGKPFDIVEGDIRDQSAIENALARYGCTSVMHFAGLKSVQDSVAHPLEYYNNNVIGSHNLLNAMEALGIKKLIFSSSASVYGKPIHLPCAEDHPLSAINPYGRTKLIIEEMLRDQFARDPSWSIVMLRYFNPVGAHESGLIGEDPTGIPNNLIPVISQVASGRRAQLDIWGNDYDTPDGTGVRDYIHVMDLVIGHVFALGLLRQPKCVAINLGTGHGNSVLEVVKAFEKSSARPIPYRFMPRRPGDPDISYAATSYARELMGWQATRSLETMCVDHWRWQAANPTGYM